MLKSVFPVPYVDINSFGKIVAVKAMLCVFSSENVYLMCGRSASFKQNFTGTIVTLLE